MQYLQVFGATGEVHHTMLCLFSHTTSTLDVFIQENKVIGNDFSSTDIAYIHTLSTYLHNISICNNQQFNGQ